MIINIISFFIILSLFYLVNNYAKKEYFCYGNAYCNGNKDNNLCINQTCNKCGLNPVCTKDSDCQNNCIDGCCDGF